MDEFPTLDSYPDLPSRPRQAPPVQTCLSSISNHSQSSRTESIRVLNHSISSFHHHPIKIGTRNSKLALAQADLFEAALRTSYPDQSTLIKSMTTTGDENLLKPLYLLGGKSLWTKELEFELLEGRVDLVVHSLKDMPTSLPPGCELGAILEREDPRDALVVRKDLPFKHLAEFPPGSVIGTSSVRRVAQLRRRFPQLQFQDIRGNLHTRFKKLDAPESPYTAIVLAVAGLKRLGCSDRITSFLEPPDLFHSVGQGAIGIEIRTPQAEQPGETAQERLTRERTIAVKKIVKSLEDWRTSFRCETERALLRRLEGGCSVPVGCSTSVEDLIMPCPWAPKAKVTLTGVVTSVDGAKEVQFTRSMSVIGSKECHALGTLVADELLKLGAQDILDELDCIKSQSNIDIDDDSQPNLTRIGAVEKSTGRAVIAHPADCCRTVIGSNQNHSLLT